MKRSLKSLGRLLMILLLALGSATMLTACEDDSPGDKLDDAVDEAGDAAEDAGDKVEDALD